MGVAYPVSVDQLEDGHALILGTTGSGKTYQLRGMLEQLRRADRRVGAIDKLGNHWGLTTDADGKSRGLDFVIFGGKRAQIPMTPAQGGLLGKIFVERNVPAIFDVSQWHADDQQRWVAAFADAVFMANEAALHLAMDEAQSWVPQGGGGDAFRSVQRLAEQGRGNGIRLLLSCQRMSRLDATVRGMVHLVVAMRQPGVLDRKAVKDQIAASAHDAAVLDRDLPKMPTGTGYLWSADGAELTKIAFPRNATFDSSRTPRHGDAAPAPIAVSSALVDELRKALSTKPAPAITGNDSAAADRIADLEAELDGLRNEIAPLRHDRETLDILASKVPALVATIADRLAELHGLFEESPLPELTDLHPPTAGSDPEPITDRRRVSPRAVQGEPTPSVSAGSPASSGLAPRLQSLLDWLAWAQAVYGARPVRRDLLAMILGRHPRSKGFLNDLGELRSAGLVDYPTAGEIQPTDTGRASAALPPIRPTLQGVRDAIAQILQPAQVRIFEIVVAAWPDPIARDDVASRLDTHPRTKTLLNNVGRLSSMGLITYPRPGELRAADFLMRKPA